ncbi:FAD-dependent oxidoreductase [Planctomicrobium piriforme]|uniref:Glycine/D-amino acid oxidase n=1 Tax=Planctomicrobium piriforme TaxID=1576369 RepID=A0A1I3S112_9PLAN|nr:FAD-dependent oxidoreductase [Planctomicrobium piriforme]SFJ51259.1 Glycine/D-amino acid oxidase [Planctomicrobium piriforme]
MQSSPFWDQGRQRLTFPELKKDGDYDVVVVGGGITGVTTAYLLKQAGRKVCLVEKGHVAGGETGHTSAHLSYVTDSRFSELVKNFGVEEAGLVWSGGGAAIDLIERLVTDNNLDCDFKRLPGFLVADLAPNHKSTSKETDDLQEDAKTARDAGFEATFLSSIFALHEPGVRFADQARFHPVKYVQALAKLIPGDGCDLFEQAEVSEVQDDPLTVVTNGFSLRCEKVIIATHVPLMGKAGFLNASLFQTKLYPYSSYVISAKIPHKAMTEAVYWDLKDPYDYLRIDSGETHDEAILGGEDHKTGQESDTEAAFQRLEQKLLRLLPKAKIDHRWSGQVVETNDGLPYIGEIAKNQFVATGFSGNGLTFGTLAAMMASDYVVGRTNPWSDLLAVERKKIKGGAWDYLTENLDFPYYFVRDWLVRGDRGSTRSVKRGEGKILKIDGQTVACSRDESGKLSQCSAVCTHMGCLVRWNNAEKTWDCPCHGSRFAATGEVIGGPAEEPLAKVGKARRSTGKRKS